MPEVINKVQQAYLNIIKLMDHNELDGEQICAFLVSNLNMWQAVYPTFVGHNELLPLRDLEKGILNMDRIYLKVGIAERQWMVQTMEEEFKSDKVIQLPCAESNKLMGVHGYLDNTIILCAWWD